MGMNTKVLESILEAVNVTGDELLDELMDIEAAMPAAVDLAPVVQVLADIRGAMPESPAPVSTLTEALTPFVGHRAELFTVSGEAYRAHYLEAVGINYVMIRAGQGQPALFIPFSNLKLVEEIIGG